MSDNGAVKSPEKDKPKEEVVKAKEGKATEEKAKSPEKSKSPGEKEKPKGKEGEEAKKEEKATTTTSTEDEKKKAEENLSEAVAHLAAGKRNLFVADIPGAVNSMAEACRMLGEHYGETAPECGEAYFYYGKALLEMSRLENGVFENVLDGVPDGEDAECSGIENPDKMADDEKEVVFKQVGEAIEECNETCDLKMKAKKEDEKAKKEGADKKSGEEKKDAAGDSASKKEDDKPSKKDDDKPSKADDAASKTKDDKTKGDGESSKAKEEGKKTEKSDGDKTATDKAKKDEEESAENSTEEDEDEEGGDEEQKEGEEEDAAEEEEGAEAAEGAENESIASNDAGPSAIKEKDDKSAVEKEDEEDPSSLQLAWEMLELAKSCLKRLADSLPAEAEKRMTVEARLSETYMKLGEVSIESENYPQAVEDLNTCLRRRQELLPADSRTIAETHYQIGVALGFNMEFDAAVGSLEEAIAVLEQRIAKLKTKTESQDPHKKEDAFYTREKEIKEIEDVIPEIREKIADTKDMQVETSKKLGDKVFAVEKELGAISTKAIAAKSSGTKTNGAADAGKSSDKTTNGGTESSPSKNGTSSKTSDITHMVKKRKKDDEETPVSEATDPKKAKSETNGKTEESAAKA